MESNSEKDPINQNSHLIFVECTRGINMLSKDEVLLEHDVKDDNTSLFTDWVAKMRPNFTEKEEEESATIAGYVYGAHDYYHEYITVKGSEEDLEFVFAFSGARKKDSMDYSVLCFVTTPKDLEKFDPSQSYYIELNLERNILRVIGYGVVAADKLTDLLKS